jgi:hypothetical protein
MNAVCRVLLLLTLAFAVSAVVFAADKQFKSSIVTFHVQDSSVSRFTLTASAFCISVSKSASEVRVIPLDSEGEIAADGRFTLGYDKQGTKVSVSGRIKGAAAEGHFDVRYSKTLTVYDPITHQWKPVVAACTAKSTWTARQVESEQKK